MYRRVLPSTKEETKLRFCKPAAVFLVGSYIQKNRTRLPLTIDMTLQLDDVRLPSLPDP